MLGHSQSEESQSSEQLKNELLAQGHHSVAKGSDSNPLIVWQESHR